MAKWNVRIKKKLKIGQNQLEEGVYINTEVFDRFVSWLRAEKFKESTSDEPMSDERKESLLSPDGEWVISFRQTAKDFVYVQLSNFKIKESRSKRTRKTPEKVKPRDEGHSESKST